MEILTCPWFVKCFMACVELASHELLLWVTKETQRDSCQAWAGGWFLPAAKLLSKHVKIPMMLAVYFCPRPIDTAHWFIPCELCFRQCIVNLSMQAPARA